jgi:hypothetical protein
LTDSSRHRRRVVSHYRDPPECCPYLVGLDDSTTPYDRFSKGFAHEC